MSKIFIWLCYSYKIFIAFDHSGISGFVFQCFNFTVDLCPSGALSPLLTLYTLQRVGKMMILATAFLASTL